MPGLHVEVVHYIGLDDAFPRQRRDFWLVRLVDASGRKRLCNPQQWRGTPHQADANRTAKDWAEFLDVVVMHLEAGATASGGVPE